MFLAGILFVISTSRTRGCSVSMYVCICLSVCVFLARILFVISTSWMSVCLVSMCVCLSVCLCIPIDRYRCALTCTMHMHTRTHSGSLCSLSGIFRGSDGSPNADTDPYRLYPLGHRYLSLPRQLHEACLLPQQRW